MKLTSLLRGVLHTGAEFVTLGDELKLISSYLDIERARFEERLRVRFDVPQNLLGLRIPSLLIQPLVENAVKHGIAPSRYGGEVVVTARLANVEAGDGSSGDEILKITVSDTGVGASEIAIVRGRRQGVGLSNVEQRLRCYAGEAASLEIRSVHGTGTTVYIKLPMASLGRLSSEMSPTQIPTAKERRGA
jgi:sensor histidine kinase YesM